MTVPSFHIYRLFSFTLVLGFILSFSIPCGAASQIKERDDCARNLQAIYEAVQSYRSEFQKMPNWLSDLIPNHLDKPERLICPVTQRTGEIINLGLSDPKVSTSYVYEFCDHPVPDSIHGGSNRTMMEWKQLQMALAGSIVPILRCHHHTIVVNLSFDGVIYESQESWEAAISGIVRPEHLAPKYLFDRFGFNPMNRFAMVDLSPFYNCSLTESIHTKTGAESGPNLAMIPDGEQIMGGVAFDVGGILHLQGRELKKIAPDRYPENVQNIPVNFKARRMHFLVGAGWPSADDTEVARFTLHYEGGGSAIIPIQYNREVRDWIHGVVGGQNAPTPAWSGDINPSPNDEQVIHLYRVSWDNPQPDTMIESLDLESTMQETALFVVGISAVRSRETQRD
jgi:hypothetical protein